MSSMNRCLVVLAVMALPLPAWGKTAGEGGPFPSCSYVTKDHLFVPAGGIAILAPEGKEPPPSRSPNGLMLRTKCPGRATFHHARFDRLVSCAEEQGRHAMAGKAIGRSPVYRNDGWPAGGRIQALAERDDVSRALDEPAAMLPHDPHFADAPVKQGPIAAGYGDDAATLRNSEMLLPPAPTNKGMGKGPDHAFRNLASAADTAVSPGGDRLTGTRVATAVNSLPAPIPPPLKTVPQMPFPGAGGAVPGQAGESRRIETARSADPGRPFTLVYPAELERVASEGMELALKHPDLTFQMSLRIGLATAGMTAGSAVRGPSASLGRQERLTFPDYALEHRAIVTLPAGPAHVFDASMTSRAGSPLRLRVLVAELFHEGLKYEMTFTMSDDHLESSRLMIDFMLANFAPTHHSRGCCVDSIVIPW